MPPVSIIGISGLPVESIEFGPAARFTVRHNEMAWFVADKWAPFQRLTMDFGARFDWDSITNAVNTAPHFGAALMLTKDAKTILKGGSRASFRRVCWGKTKLLDALTGNTKELPNGSVTKRNTL